MTLQAAADTACNTCRKPILNRRSSMQVRCIPCVIAAANAKDKATAKAQRQAAIDARKKDAADTRARRIALKSRSDWLSEAQAAFNAYIRARDELAGLPCVSCLRHHKGSWDAGHYLTRGARPELRFDEQNCWRQCVPCNQHLHGNLILYRVELVKRIGLPAVEALEGPHQAAKYTVDELRQIRDTYRARARSLKAQLETAMEVSTQVSAEVSK